jgi:hypothetical protein
MRSSWLAIEQGPEQGNPEVPSDDREHEIVHVARGGGAGGLTEIDPLWEELFPSEQARIPALLVERVDVRVHRVEVRIRPSGLAGVVRELVGGRRAVA